MTRDDLRALADALEPMAKAPRFVGRDIPAFCAYLRAQADAQPVQAVPLGHALSAVRHVGSANYPDRERAAIERLYSAKFDAYAHPAPAAPQAEPKREPLSDERIEIPGYLRLQIAGTAAAHDVLAERRRQVEAEGWTPAHDDKHIGGQMAMAAACYAAHAAVDECIHCTSEDTLPSLAVLLARAQGFVAQCWPWSHRWWKPSDRRRNLVKAGALILAEIERLDRAALAAREPDDRS